MWRQTSQVLCFPSSPHYSPEECFIKQGLRLDFSLNLVSTHEPRLSQFLKSRLDLSKTSLLQPGLKSGAYRVPLQSVSAERRNIEPIKPHEKVWGGNEQNYRRERGNFIVYPWKLTHRCFTVTKYRETLVWPMLNKNIKVWFVLVQF